MCERRTLFVLPGESIGEVLEQARAIYHEAGDECTIMISPGDYEEELTIDIPNLKLVNIMALSDTATMTDVYEAGTKIGPNAVRISWYYGHGYQYRSMGDRINYGGKRERRWNASVLVDAPGFYAEGIIFQNSFNLYVSPAEAQDSLWNVGDMPELSAKEKARTMPARPRDTYNIDVQQRYYGERASALSLTSNATNTEIRRCRIVGRQDAFYGDHGADVYLYECILQGGVDYIFGGMNLTCKHSILVGQVNNEKGDRCYIAAGRGANKRMCQAEHLDSIPEDEFVKQGMLFEHCLVRYANRNEIANPVDPTDAEAVESHPIWLCRPWRWWGEHIFRDVRGENGLAIKHTSLGLTKNHPAPYVTIQ